MSRPPAGKRPGGRTTGTNTLITAASLALTLSGWAVIADSEAEPIAPAPTSAPAQIAAPPATLPAIPTLLPTPDWASLTPASPVAALVAPTAAPAAPPAAVAQPAAPPTAVTVTRSSR